MSEWRELTWDDAIQWGDEALVGGEALYEKIDALSQAHAWLLMAGAGLATTRLRQSGALSTAPAVHTQTSTGYGLVPGARR